MKDKTKTILIAVIFSIMISIASVMAFISATTDYETIQTVEFRTRNFFITTPTMGLSFVAIALLLFIESDEDKERKAKKKVE